MELVSGLDRTYGHHGTAAGTSDEDLGGVGLVLLECPLDHVGNGVAVSSSLMAQGSLAADIPALALVRRLWVDDDEAILLRKLGVRAASVVGLRSTGAVVDSNDNSWRCRKLLGHVDVETGLGGCSTKRGNLGESARCHGTLAEASCCSRSYGQEAGESSEEAHGVDLE